MWARIEDRLALLELLALGRLERRRSQATAFDWLAELPWTRASGRRDEVVLVAEHRWELLALLDRVWEEWREVHMALLEAGEPPTPRGLRRMRDQQRAEGSPELPERVNRRTAAATTASSAKAALTSGRRALLGDAEVVGDGLVRLRPPRGVWARRRGRAVALDEVAAVLDEVGVAERALRDELVLEGRVEAIVTVENLGAWRDMPQPDGWLLAHVPGWNTATVRLLLERFEGTPVMHFGDLDPNGVRIYLHLREQVPDLRWLVPDFWRELVPLHGQAREWPEALELSWAPALVWELAAAGTWLEQERLVLDPRFEGAMLACLAGRASGE